MSEQRRLLALTAFHALLLVPPIGAVVFSVVASAGEDLAPALAWVLLAYLAVVIWWATRHAISKLPGPPRSVIDAYIAAGIRSGAIAGALYVGGILAPLFIWNTKVALFGPDPYEPAFVGGEWAFVWIAAILIAVGVVAGIALGGVIAIIDRALLAIAHSIRAAANSR